MGKQERPKEIIIFGIIEIILSGIFFIMALVILFILLAFWDPNNLSFSKNMIIVGILILVLTFKISLFVGAAGILRGEEWARKVLIVGSIVSIIYSISSFVFQAISIQRFAGSSLTGGSFGSMMGFAMIPIAYRSVLIIYLNKDHVKAYLKKEKLRKSDKNLLEGAQNPNFIN